MIKKVGYIEFDKVTYNGKSIAEGGAWMHFCST